MKTGYYAADDINGVYYVGDIICDENVDILQPRMFLDSLLYADETIYTFLDLEHEEIYDEIEKQYGIR